MKLINKNKLLEIARNYFLFFIASYVLIVSLAMYLQTPFIEMIISKSPSIVGVKFYDFNITVVLIVFVSCFASLSFKIFKVLASEHFKIIDNYIEGPNQFGERIVIAKNQIKTIGLDYFGQFSIFTEDQKLVLPGKIDFQIERQMKRKLSTFLKY